MFRLLYLPLVAALVAAIPTQRIESRALSARVQTDSTATLVASWSASRADSVRVAYSTGVTRTRLASRGVDTLTVAKTASVQTITVTLTPLRGGMAFVPRTSSITIPARPLAPATIDSIRLDTTRVSASVVTPPPVIGPAAVSTAFTINLPAGLTSQCDVAFSQLSESQGSTGCGLYFRSFVPGGGSVVPTPDAPFAPVSFQMRFPAGDIGGAGGPAILAGTAGQRWQRLYIALAVRLSDNYVMHANEEKFLYPRLTDGASPAALNLAWRPSADPQTSGIMWHARSWRPEGGGINVFSEPHAAPPYMQRGRWHVVEVFVRLNTPGQYDGTLLTWLDGAPQVVRHNVRFYAETTPRAMSELLFDATRGGGSDGGSAVPAGGMTRQYNRLAVFASEAR